MSWPKNKMFLILFMLFSSFSCIHKAGINIRKNNTTETEQDVDAHLTAGIWKQNLCSLDGHGGSASNIVTSDPTSTEIINYEADLYSYNALNCPSDSGISNGLPTNLGTVTFDKMLVDGQAKYLKGTWTRPGNISLRTVWALKTPSSLCILIDSGNIYPTIESIRNAVATTPTINCYERIDGNSSSSSN